MGAELLERSNGVAWDSRDDCVIDCANSWRIMDYSAWQFIAKLHHAKETYGEGILLAIAECRHGSVKTLRNMSSLWNNPAREIAMELELTPGHVNVISGIASDNLEQAEDYLRIAAERSLSVGDLRWHVESAGSTYYPDVRNEEPPFADFNSVLYREPARREPEADFMVSRSMAARDVAATLQRLDAEVLREVAKLLLEFLKLPIDNAFQL